MTTENKPITILKLETSLRGDDSLSTQASDVIVKQLLNKNHGAKVVTRNLYDNLPMIDGEWVGANFTDETERTPDQVAKLALSDELIEELVNTDFLVIGLPVYNFGIPAALKTWVDHIARARKTFRYTENGPVGLLADRETKLVFASGGTPVGASFEFATPYMKQALAFVGITNIEIVEAKKLLAEQEVGA